MDTPLDVLINAASLNERLEQGAEIQLVDLGSAELYAQAHIPGAISFDYAWLVSGVAPAAGLMASPGTIHERLEASGISSESPIVAYDGEGTGKSARFCWTLDVLGFTNWSMLDGGLQAWAAASLPLDNRPVTRPPAHFVIGEGGDARVADADYILSRLDDDDFALLDARTPGEYAGTDVRASRGGHIPGARNFNWLDSMDPDNSGQLRDADLLRAQLTALGLTPDQEIVAYCQTHHRSSQSYVMLKAIGYERIRGYPGSWSEWGNRVDLPVTRR